MIKAFVILCVVCGLLVSCDSVETSKLPGTLDCTINAATEEPNTNPATDAVTDEQIPSTDDVEDAIGGQPSVAVDGIHHEMYYAVEMSFIDYFIGADEFYNDFVPKFKNTRDKTYRGICEYYGISKEEYGDFWEKMRADFNDSYLSEIYDFDMLYPLETKYDAWFSDNYETAEAFMAEDASDLTIEKKNEFANASSSYVSSKRDAGYTIRYYTIDSKLIDYVGKAAFDRYLLAENDMNIESFIDYFNIDKATYLEIYEDDVLYPYNPDYLFAESGVESVFEVNAKKRADVAE